MALPKKRNINFNITPPLVGNDRVEELLKNTDLKSTFLPKTIDLYALDKGLFDFVKEGDIKIVLDSVRDNKVITEAVPAFFLSNERWGEFSKTWQYTDGDKNIATPFITVRRTNKADGTHSGLRYTIPKRKTFKYLEVPELDNGLLVLKRYKIPQPAPIDLIYDVRLFTKYQKQINAFDEKVIKAFSSRQNYLTVKGHLIPLVKDSMTNNDTLNNINGDRMYISSYSLRVMGYIQDENEFEITKTIRLKRIDVGIEKDFIKSKIVAGDLDEIVPGIYLVDEDGIYIIDENNNLILLT